MLFAGKGARARRLFAGVSATVAAFLALSVLSPVAAVADEDDPLAHVTVQLQKTLTPETVTPATPNGRVSYSIGVNCSDLETDCINLRIEDALPAPLVLQSVAMTSNPGQADAPTSNIVITGNSFVATFTTDLGGGNQGLVAGVSAEFIVTAMVPQDASSDFNGQTIVNTAYAKLDNLNSDKSASASLPLSVPVTLAAQLTKTISPDTVPAIVTTTVATVTLDAQNKANRSVDSLVIQDPGSTTTLFDYAAVTGITVPTWPTGADRVQVDWFTTSWQTGTPQAQGAIAVPSPASAIKGLRFTFTSTSGGIARDAHAVVEIATALRNTTAVTTIDPSVRSDNTASATVSYNGVTSDPATASASLTINKVTVNPLATKIFTPDSVVGGKKTTVTLTGSNGGTYVLKNLTITEPAAGTPTLDQQGLVFESWAASAIEWPVGATAASVSFLYADAPGVFATAVPASTRNTLPDPEVGRTVIGFRVEFTGTAINAGQYAKVPYVAETTAVTADETNTNTISVDVTTTNDLTASTTASDDLTRRTARVNTTVAKTMSPSTIYSVAGAYTLISLPSFVAPQPTGVADPLNPTGSTVGATKFTISDTADPATDPFWNNFDATAIVSTDIPAGAKLSVEYWDGAAWVALDSAATDIEGPLSFGRVFTSDERRDIQGLRFVYEAADADTDLAPGFNAQPNIRAVLRSTLRSDPGTPASGSAVTTTIDNTVRTDVENAAASPTAAHADLTRSLTVLGVSGGGSGGIDLISKTWNNAVSTGIKAVNARSNDRVSSTLSWGTGGLPFESVVITDTAAGSSGNPAAVSGTAFEAFNLVSIAAINSTSDPLMKWDAVSGVELYYGGAWHPTETNPCAVAADCDATFPGYVLSDAERTDATAARLTFVESPTRGGRIGSDPLAPPVGSGVAPTMAQTRHITLLFELRDVRRSDGEAVLGTSRGALYNSGAGLVINNASIAAHPFTGATRTDTGADSIQIIDKPINVLATKTWTGGPLGTPPDHTPQELYPSSRLVVSAQNTSVIKVNQLKLVEPSVAVGATNPFEFVNITRINSITVPAGTVTTTVTLQPIGRVLTNVADVVALTEDELEDVTGIEVVHDGRISPSSRTTVSMNVQLRMDERSTGDPIDAQVLDNTVLATVTDPSGVSAPTSGTDNVVTDDESAQMAIEVFDYNVIATKEIDADTDATPTAPAIQYGGSSNKAEITLGGRPTGNVRTTRMVIEDISPTFWNAYAFDAFTTNSLASPINRVQVDVLLGTTYDLVAGELVVLCNGSPTLDDCWTTTGTASNAFALPSGSYTKADIRGVRFTFTRSDFTAWERPFNPEQYVNFTVARRTNLTWDPSGHVTPVPSTLYIYPDPAPGETARATFTNGVKVTVSAAADPSDTTPLWWASSTDTKQLTYKHLPAKVEVAVKPVGALSLGPEIPYQIDVTNRGTTGDKPLSGVVVDFTIPVDGTGAELQLPLDPDTGDPIPLADAFSYVLVNGAGATQTAPLVVANLGTATPAGQVVTFTVPGTIPLGWKLSIKMRLNFRPFLEAGTSVETPVKVVSDQQFDTCWAFQDDGIARPTLSDQPDCRTTTTVKPLASVPMTITKGVRGVGAGPLDAAGDPLIDPNTGSAYSDLGILKTQTASPVECDKGPNLSVNGNGYYKYPCVPITRPGATEEWVAKFTNSGNVNVGKVVAIDLLPTANDTGVIIADSRGSRWTPKLSEFPQLVDLASGTLTVYYTSTPLVATPRCNGADIQHTMGMSATSTPAMNPDYLACMNDTGRIDDVLNRDWQELLPSDDLAAMNIVALKFVVTTATGVIPGTSMAITYKTTTAAVPEIVEADTALGRDSVAYNSIAGAAVGINRDTQILDLAYRFVTEPRKVGVAMATGQVSLLKTVDGTADSKYRPTSFELELSCVSAGETIVLKDSTGAARSPITVVPGVAKAILGIPLYAKCTVTENTDYGQTAKSVTPSVVTAQAAQNKLQGSQVTNEHPTFGSRPAVEVSTVTNTYSAASLTITKTVDNGGAVNQAGAPIAYRAAAFRITCTFDNGAPGGAQVILPTETFNLADGATKVYTGLVAGAECTVTETNTRGAATTQYTVTQDGVTSAPTTGTTKVVTLVANDTTHTMNNTVAFSNTYAVGSLTLRKVVDGAAKDTWGNGTFTINVTCTLSNASPNTVWNENIVLTKSGTTQIPDRLVSDYIANGASCTVTESDANDAGASSKDVPGATTIATATPRTLTVKNTFTNASLTVTKAIQTDAVDQNGATVYPAVTFDFTVSCTWEGRTVLATQNFTLARTETKTFSDLPTDAVCTITETATGGADSTTIQTTTGSGTTSANATTATTPKLTAGANSILVTNRYGVASFTVTKSSTGGASAQFGQGPFTIHVTCTEPSGVTAFDQDIVLGPGSWDRTIDNLVTGSKCSAVESDREGADAQRTIFDSNDVVSGNLVTVTTSNPGHATITNYFLTGSVVVTKQVAGDSAAYGVGPFEVTLECTRDGQPIVITGGAARTLSPGSMSTTYTQLPSGAECVLSETETGGATSSFIATNVSSPLTTDVASGWSFPITVTTTSLVDNQAQTPLFVVNTFDAASLVISKRVDSAAVDAANSAIPYGPFPVSVVCYFEGAQVYATGYSSTVAMQKDMTAGVDWRLDGLAAGTSCEITETNTKDAVSPYIDTTVGTTARHWNTPTATVVLVPNDGTTPKTTARITNPYASGEITLAKFTSGAGSAWATETFTVDVECTLTDASGSRSVWSKSYDLTAGAAATPLANVAAGADCTITESKTGGASSTSIKVGTATAVSATTSSFTSPAGAILPIVVDNTFDFASVDVTKQFTGSGSTLWGTGPFEVTLECTRESNGATLPVTIPGGDTRTLETPLYAASFDDLPFGADCRLTETKTGGANNSTVSPAGYFELDQPANAVTVVNNFTEGSIAVEKTPTGLGAPLWGNGPFEVSLECTRVVDGATTAVTIPGGATRALESGTGFTARYDNLPTGADCTLRESKTGGATVAAGPEAATIGNGTTVQIDLENEFEIGKLIVTNIVTGNNWEPNSKKPFVVELECTLDIDGVNTPIDIPGGASRDIMHLGEVEYDDLPINAVCDLYETVTNGAEIVTITPVDPTSSGIAGRGAGPIVALKTVTITSVTAQFDVVNVFTKLANTGALVLPFGLAGLLVSLIGVALWSAGRLRTRRAA